VYHYPSSPSLLSSLSYVLLLTFMSTYSSIFIFTFFFFFSSRRRHTRFSRDWSSDVCSSDLKQPTRSPWGEMRTTSVSRSGESGRSEERRVGKSVDLGGRRRIKKKKRI